MSSIEPQTRKLDVGSGAWIKAGAFLQRSWGRALGGLHDADSMACRVLPSLSQPPASRSFRLAIEQIACLDPSFLVEGKTPNVRLLLSRLVELAPEVPSASKLIAWAFTNSLEPKVFWAVGRKAAEDGAEQTRITFADKAPKTTLIQTFANGSWEEIGQVPPEFTPDFVKFIRLLEDGVYDGVVPNLPAQFQPLPRKIAFDWTDDNTVVLRFAGIP